MSRKVQQNAEGNPYLLKTYFMPPKLYIGIEHGIRFDLHLTCMISGKHVFLRFFAGYKEMINEKQKHPQTRLNSRVYRCFHHWSARRDSNPRPLESESTAISSFATGG